MSAVRNYIQNKQTYDCFGNYGIEELSPTQALGKLSATAMLTTSRVGDPDEDETMAQARPRLSEINKRGFVTTDSQMGVKKMVYHTIHGDAINPPVDQWQRSYVTGILAKDLGEEFKKKLRFLDGIDFSIGPHAESRPVDRQHVHFINVTVYQQEGDEPEFSTNTPMAAESFGDNIANILPDIQHVMQSETCQRIVKEDSLHVMIVDLVWGRPFWLFDKVIEVLDEVISEIPR